MAAETPHAQTTSTPLVDRLKQISRSSHNVSNGLVMARLAVACTDEKLYARALEAFWYIHTSITEAVEKHKNHPALKSIAQLSARADRKAAFEADLRFFRGERWIGAPSAPVKAYMDHISEISEKDPVLLVAHAYTQQMALLAGGQRISKLISSTLPKVDGNEGVSVFAFREPVWQLKNDYSDAVNALTTVLDEETVERILQEHVQVFELNNRVIGSFPVRARHSLQAFKRLLPPELLMCMVAAVFAGFMMFLVPHFNRFAAWLDGPPGADVPASLTGSPAGAEKAEL
ncbi:probable heme oxygenase 2 [Coccomyxa sp. Obi]|nr:probable heme oxygenase 2 [Coccomyxa sp. Obi]